MSVAYGVQGPSYPVLGELAYRLSLSVFRGVFGSRGFHRPQGRLAREQARSMRERLASGESVYLLGIHAGSHNSGAALVRVSPRGGVRLLCNNEEERYTGIKHYAGYPQGAVDALAGEMEARALKPDDLHACLISFDHAVFVASGLRRMAEEFPAGVNLLRAKAMPEVDQKHARQLLQVPARLAKQLGRRGRFPIIGMQHHDTHAWFSYATSPFACSEEPVLVTVVDGNGDDNSISIYLGVKGKLQLLRSNGTLVDSLGTFYRILASTQGGWTPLSSEGRYMGATAWGNSSRLTNPYYHQLREVLHFGEPGMVRLNRALAEWHRRGFVRPYTDSLVGLIGPPIPYSEMWNPDAVLRLDGSLEEAMDPERFDKAAAVQMVFEDALFHIIGYWIRKTGANQLVLTGGTALNCLANMRLLDHFDEGYYERNLRKKGVRLHIWVPPVPSDTGNPAGAAFCFALTHGAQVGSPLKHAFYCGRAPSSAEIRTALRGQSEFGWLALDPRLSADDLGDLLAYVVARDGVIGLYQGRAETGPRALGHRSILANPSNPKMMKILNAKVKFREPFRPLAPMVTLEAAHDLFELSAGASDDEYNAYNYMVLTAASRPSARRLVPAVIHKDGTSRLQVVRRETDPLTHAYLRSMGWRLGVEASVNTSLNVGSPIVQSPEQALGTLKRAKGLDAVLLVGESGDAFVAWHNVEDGPKDCGRTVRRWIQDWGLERSVQTTWASFQRDHSASFCEVGRDGGARRETASIVGPGSSRQEGA